MGADLIAKVRNFSIETKDFPADSPEVAEGCTSAGTHRLLRFDFVASNVGNADFVIGDPQNHPELFYFSPAHHHYHFKQFNEYRLFDAKGNLVMPGKKAGFCLEDFEHTPGGGPAQAQFTCQNQGISVGWSDVYTAGLDCQFIVIDEANVPDGDYTLVATTNAGHLLPEDSYTNNSTCVGLRIVGEQVTEIDPPVAVVRKTQTVQFLSVPEGETRVAAAVFEVRACREVTMKITSGPDFVSGSAGSVFGTTVLLGTSDTVSADGDVSPQAARIWITYKGTSDGDSAVGTVTIQCVETGENFVVPLTANTIARPKAVVAMVLDKSGSMLDDAGDGRTRIRLLHDSATPFVDRLHEKDSVGIVSFDQDPHDVLPLTTIGSLDDASDTSRANAREAILSHTPNPAGLTAIGDGIEAAHNLLAPVAASFGVVATVVLTDGQNTAPKSVDDVMNLVSSNQQIYAIGLGTPEEIDPSTLNKICAGHDGYLLMTGQFTDQSKFRLAKYYQQILASVKNDQIVTDPESAILPGQTHRIPFDLNETDISADVVLLTPAPKYIDFRVETPAGTEITPALAAGSPEMAYFAGDQTSYYRIGLPAVVKGASEQSGTWTAVLRVLDNEKARRIAESSPHGLPYNLSVLTYSDLRLRGRLSQTGLEPGALVTLRATLTEYGLPVGSARATVTAEVERPDGTVTMFNLPEMQAGVFEFTFAADHSGIYHVHFRANGYTMRGRTFTREQLLTAQVWQGGNQPLKPSTGDGTLDKRNCCRAIIWLAAIGLFLLLIIIILLLFQR